MPGSWLTPLTPLSGRRELCPRTWKMPISSHSGRKRRIEGTAKTVIAYSYLVWWVNRCSPGAEEAPHVSYIGSMCIQIWTSLDTVGNHRRSSKKTGTLLLDHHRLHRAFNIESRYNLFMILEKSQLRSPALWTPSVTTWRRSVTATCTSEYARLYKPHLYFEISAILNFLFWSFGHSAVVIYLHSEAHKKLFDLQRLKGQKLPLCWWHCCFHAWLPNTASNNQWTIVLPLALRAVG